MPCGRDEILINGHDTPKVDDRTQPQPAKRPRTKNSKSSMAVDSYKQDSSYNGKSDFLYRPYRGEIIQT